MQKKLALNVAKRFGICQIPLISELMTSSGSKYCKKKSPFTMFWHCKTKFLEKKCDFSGKVIIFQKQRTPIDLYVLGRSRLVHIKTASPKQFDCFK